ncbi:MAG: hypothetical protein M1818_008328 [Claussenomyces sp. TS43310]|nr:MAG: hypothetical protein M1818_008328 [Claussenomyces sp. TS43310]
MDDNLPGDHEHASNQSEMSLIKDDQEPFCHFFRNSNPETTILSMDSSSEICIPPMSTYLQGELESTSHIFTSTAPSFDLIILDPPWPNRSARRKKSYSISYTTADIAALLSSIPIKNHLTEDSFVGIWITNKPAFHDLVLSSGGIFDQWDVELSEEWIWLKVTSSGTPISSLAGTWRKPYEVFLLGRKKLSSGSRSPSIKRRVLVAVPDLHSRKPNMKTLFESMLPSKYEALEIFARNLTAGWWAWGNEVLKFQHQDQWTADVSDCQ